MSDWKGVKPEAEKLVRAVLFADTPPQESAADALRRAAAHAFYAGARHAVVKDYALLGSWTVRLDELCQAIERGEVDI